MSRRGKDILEVEDQYYILATSSFADDRTCVLKHADTFAVYDRHGDVIPLGLGEYGLFFQGTRFLSRCMLLLGTRRPLLLGSTVLESNDALSVDLTNPDLTADGEAIIAIHHGSAEAGEGSLLPHGTLHLSRTRFLWRATAYERLEIANHGTDVVEVKLRLEFDADYADIFEVRGMQRPARGRRIDDEVGKDRVFIGYDGLDGVRRRTELRFSPTPSSLEAGAAEFLVELEPGTTRVLDISVRCHIDGVTASEASYDEAAGEAGKALAELEGDICRITTSNTQFNAWLARSVSDMHMLVTETSEGPYPYAGVPWYSTVFGRDGILTALELLWSHPSLARGVLSHLASTQARELDADRDAEPGKILHECRTGEMAALGEVPFGRYYGTIDATPLFIVLAGAYHRRTGDDAFLRALWPNIELALTWIDHHGDRDGDGFLEYERSTEAGLANQGWKDSWDSVSHADGSLARAPVALCEVQGYAFAALSEASRLTEVLGDEDHSRELARRADDLRHRFDKAFWDDELGCYALALDGDKRPCRVVSSNAGHCLFSGIALPHRARPLALTLLGLRMFSGWGVRTLSMDAARYNPMSYHNGSVWPHDNALIAAGFARYGLPDEAIAVTTGLFEASLFVELHRLPELVCGFSRREAAGPVLYPVACAPQAWAAGASFMLVQSLLGITVDASKRRVTFFRPLLPEYVDWLRLDQLEVAGSRVDILLERHPGDVSVRVLSRTEGVEIVVVK